MNTVPKSQIVKEYAAAAARDRDENRRRVAAKAVRARPQTAKEIERDRRRTLPACARCAAPEGCTTLVSPRYGREVCAFHAGFANRESYIERN